MSPTLPHHLQQSQVYTGSDSVMVGNGEYLPITHTGSTSLASTSGTIHVSDVLVCPKIAKSLLSLSLRLLQIILALLILTVTMCTSMIRQHSGFFFKGLTLVVSTLCGRHLLRSSTPTDRSV